MNGVGIVCEVKCEFNSSLLHASIAMCNGAGLLQAPAYVHTHSHLQAYRHAEMHYKTNSSKYSEITHLDKIYN